MQASAYYRHAVHWKTMDTGIYILKIPMTLSLLSTFYNKKYDLAAINEELNKYDLQLSKTKKKKNLLPPSINMNISPFIRLQ